MSARRPDRPIPIYGGDLPSIYATIYGGRQGQMPSWEARLSPLERKILTLYVLDLRTKPGTKPGTKP
jgi:cytochrome c oxidase cbb3-type subunit 3